MSTTPLTASDTDTICAITTPPGRSGVGIIRVSGPGSAQIAEQLLHFVPKPRYAHYCPFFDKSSELLDQGIALFFPGPNSFTGEDILELQGHGGHFVLDNLLQAVMSSGARLARPGEFTERAFLNNKIDLAQAEAIADLIDSSSREAARSAVRTLQGEFSRLIERLAESIIHLRVYLEAAIDFTDEEIDFLSEGRISERLSDIISQLDEVLAQARQGALIREGMSVVIAGKPNAGKSSLLNALAGKDSAIVTDIAGTTRDVLSEQINIDGMPLHITDTAGLRHSSDIVEQEGIRRALLAVKNADRVLLMVDSSQEQVDQYNLCSYLTSPGFGELSNSVELSRITIIQNKADLTGEESAYLSASNASDPAVIRLSAKQKSGITLLKQHLKDCMGFQDTREGGFIARRRHLDALSKARECLQQATVQLDQHGAAELVAEDLRHAHQHLGEITGQFSTDDLLGRIFSSFCVGK
ncbi:MAG: tRNA uridine-5-carboxymethylaminomethyl(34) synthesis GTPase MnmE [Pseudohongiella sp.]|nr:tRNA uridine-5-carboxymethylaminomethyl(34) synthesis GTPase MnmE [Pseudohongiella sp.]MDO9520998.1 tRNA uridine-5-carboxymethylaminomethyl(34) synthesis GTPase MnmE [Pseudohongiella sp.]MDP2126852.1 tRNA uridine-5-carboxymethylaminomethyl(34) synthesis GTPase MnmE [Pseudohongiella sp.]